MNQNHVNNHNPLPRVSHLPTPLLLQRTGRRERLGTRLKQPVTVKVVALGLAYVLFLITWERVVRVCLKPFVRLLKLIRISWNTQSKTTSIAQLGLLVTWLITSYKSALCSLQRSQRLNVSEPLVGAKTHDSTDLQTFWSWKWMCQEQVALWEKIISLRRSVAWRLHTNVYSVCFLISI